MSTPIEISTTTTTTRSSRESSPSSSSSSPPPALDPSTLALLNSFYQEREQAEQEFRQLEEKAHKRLLKAQNLDGNESIRDQDDQDQTSTAEEEDKMMTVDEFRKLFQEDWQLSQFW